MLDNFKQKAKIKWILLTATFAGGLSLVFGMHVTDAIAGGGHN